VDVSSVKFKKKKSCGSYFLIGIKVKLEGRLGSMQLATDIKSGMSFRSTPSTKENEICLHKIWREIIYDP